MIRMNRTQIFSDETNRLNFYVDNEAEKLDALRVEMPATGMAGMLVYDFNKEGLVFADLWSRAAQTANWLRSQPYVRVYPSEVFIPFIEVTAVDTSREVAKWQLMGNLLSGAPSHPLLLTPRDAMHRVESLGRAVDAFAELYPPLIPKAALQC